MAYWEKGRAVAIAPNGKTIACGGWTGLDWQKNSMIYIYDRENGKMVQKITGLPNVVYSLTYSKYGRYLVGTFGGKNGICVWHTADYSLVSMDKMYQDRCHRADFNLNDSLVTSSYDGFLRLYDNQFRLIAKQKAQSGNKPYSVKFSPGGLEIAVGQSFVIIPRKQLCCQVCF